MANISKRIPRISEDWDLDLGWIILWFGLFGTILGIIICLTYSSIQNNRVNTERDRYYAEHCKIIFVAQGVGNGYQCQNK
jgi:hypothetical protein